MKVLSDFPAPRASGPANTVLYDGAGARVVGFHLLPGQRIPPHRKEATVVVHVVEGAGTFHGETGATAVGKGDTVVLAPGEVHAVEAGGSPLRFLVIITSRPER